MTVNELIDYLTQVVAEGGGELPVVLDDSDFEDEGDYVSLAFVLSEGAPGVQL